MEWHYICCVAYIVCCITIELCYTNTFKKPGVVTQACNPGIQEAEVKGSLLVGQPRLQSETRDPASKNKTNTLPNQNKNKTKYPEREKHQSKRIQRKLDYSFFYFLS